MKTHLAASVFALVLGVSSLAEAGTISQLASNNATMQNAGPRTGANGKNFYNMEASSNGSFESFGVADFTFSAGALGGTVTSINSATLALTQSNAAFSAPDKIDVYLATNTTGATAVITEMSSHEVWLETISRGCSPIRRPISVMWTPRIAHTTR